MPAAYRCRFRDFDASNASHTIGELILSVLRSGFESIYLKAIAAWEEQLQVIANTIAVLGHELPESADWQLLLEYEIPRRDRRPDAVILARDIIFVLEFKVGEDRFLSADDWQVYSYALDLRDFHQESRGRVIIPVLVATSAQDVPRCNNDDKPIRHANSQTLANGILEAFGEHHKVSIDPIDPEAWENSPYRPTPTIIEAAEQLFQGHTVSEISHAFATNLTVTTDTIVRAITASQERAQRTICFVTGIPGAGKTLAGLSAAHSPEMRSGGRPPAMFLSGNGPLVKIVCEALTRDKVRQGASREEAARTVSTFIWNVHSFLEHHLKDVRLVPHEHAIIFDEAQRAWNAKAVEKKRGVESSEPALILAVMERAPEWCTVIALVGNGQEIYTGEGGLKEWGSALNARPVPWKVLVSPELLPGGSVDQLFGEPASPHLEVVPEPALHLDVSVRSPRAKLIGDWVNGLLEHTDVRGNAELSSEFPIALTRDLNVAKRWITERTDPSERSGLLASSGALRLRAYGLEVSRGFRKGYQYTDWFLTGPEDIRSSSRLEVAATEFECQGLELDWSCVCWGGDLVFDRESHVWLHRKLRGTDCMSVRDGDEQRYMRNKYRVLLTRARKGMVIWIPNGAPDDPTLEPNLLDSTAERLLNAGIPALDE